MSDINFKRLKVDCQCGGLCNKRDPDLSVSGQAYEKLDDELTHSKNRTLVKKTSLNDFKGFVGN